ncbi:YDG/SRA domain-containing protein [Kocuria arenosa]|uniref:YDG/SRA domain-containing protein n=1 Tax=Kocuria arenosa TaxID=3071446 RepID=UPI0034D4F3C5
MVAPTQLNLGDVSGIDPGTTFKTRKAVKAAGLHRHLMNGISGLAPAPAEAIVMSTGYIQDQDLGSSLFYTGMGGRKDRRQVENQSFEQSSNASLVIAQDLGTPVRVIRGYVSTNRTPESYEYRGLFRVTDHWMEPDPDGYWMCRFRLDPFLRFDFDAISNFTARVDKPVEPASQAGPVSQNFKTISRIIRNTAAAQYIKDMYSDRCQFCETQVRLPGRTYSEGAHIRALGRPHNGPDSPDNILCLCPVCHLQFDNGGIFINQKFRILSSLERRLRPQLLLNESHVLNDENVAYHASLWGAA